jgi:hypothetical protein
MHCLLYDLLWEIYRLLLFARLLLLDELAHDRRKRHVSIDRASRKLRKDF